MTSLVIEEFAAPESERAVRTFELNRRRAADELAGRTVWCVAAVHTARRAADALRARLRTLNREGVSLRGIPIRGRKSIVRVIEDGDQLLGQDVRAGDLVVLHDPIAAALADAVRARGAHAIWRLEAQRLAEAAAEAWPSHSSRPCVDAYVMDWQRLGPRGVARTGVAAFMEGPDVVSAKELAPTGPEPGYAQLGWTSLLADVVREDHDERVGGRLHARPGVAAR